MCPIQVATSEQLEIRFRTWGARRPTLAGNRLDARSAFRTEHGRCTSGGILST